MSYELRLRWRLGFLLSGLSIIAVIFVWIGKALAVPQQDKCCVPAHAIWPSPPDGTFCGCSIHGYYEWWECLDQPRPNPCFTGTPAAQPTKQGQCCDQLHDTCDTAGIELSVWVETGTMNCGVEDDEFDCATGGNTCGCELFVTPGQGHFVDHIPSCVDGGNGCSDPLSGCS